MGYTPDILFSSVLSSKKKKGALIALKLYENQRYCKLKVEVHKRGSHILNAV